MTFDMFCRLAKDTVIQYLRRPKYLDTNSITVAFGDGIGPEVMKATFKTRST
jgi:hypothetical protein